MKFEQEKLEEILDDLERKNWLKDFDKDKKEDFIKNVCNLEFTSPNIKDVFNTFKIGKDNSIISPEDVRVLIIGQDPYPNPQKAQGLAFSHKNWDSIDASLLNIYKAIKAYKDDCKFNEVDTKVIKGEEGNNPWNTNIEMWAKNNGVLLLNTALTYESEHELKTHGIVWEPFINTIIKKLMDSDNNSKLVVFLWGKNAQCAFFNAIREMSKFEPDKCCLVRKMILMTSHPSNMGGAVNKGFSEDAPNHFKVCDEFLGTDTWKNFPENNK